MKFAQCRAPYAWPRAAVELGFRPTGQGGNYEREGLELVPEGDWLVLVDAAPEVSSGAALGLPGLWRPRFVGESCSRSFDLPPLTAEPATTSNGGRGAFSQLAQLVTWAEATRRTECPPAWTPPPRSEIEEWLDGQRFSVRAGPRVVRGELVHAPDRLALVYPRLAPVPAGTKPLSSAREAWLTALLRSAHERWRMVRFERDAEARNVRAEIDLTGVPPACARPLVQLSLESLSWAVEWLLSPLCFLVDSGAESRALERCTPTS